MCGLRQRIATCRKQTHTPTLVHTVPLPAHAPHPHRHCFSSKHCHSGTYVWVQTAHRDMSQANAHPNPGWTVPCLAWLCPLRAQLTANLQHQNDYARRERIDTIQAHPSKPALPDKTHTALQADICQGTNNQTYSISVQVAQTYHPESYFQCFEQALLGCSPCTTVGPGCCAPCTLVLCQQYSEGCVAPAAKVINITSLHGCNTGTEPWKPQSR